MASAGMTASTTSAVDVRGAVVPGSVSAGTDTADIEVGNVSLICVD